MAPPLTAMGWLRFDVVAPELTRLPDVRRVLEVGAGQGALGSWLATRFEYVAVEPDADSYRVAARRIGGRGTVLAGTTAALPKGETFDAVCAFEVLEHVADDLGALSQWRDLLRPGGWLVLSVPAYRRRFAAADRLVGHYRRYDPEDIGLVVREAGFRGPRILFYGFPLGYALEWGRNLLAARRPGRGAHEERGRASGRWLQPPSWLALGSWLLTLPFRLAQRPFVEGPLGTGMVVVAQRADVADPIP